MNNDTSSPLAQADRWHFSFAGLMLLLFGVFAILYATSRKQETVLRGELEQIRSALQTEKAKPKTAPAPDLPGGAGEDLLAVQANEALQTVILRSVSAIQAQVAGNRGKEKWVEAEARPDGGMLLRVVAPDLYKVGDRRVSETQRLLLDKLGEAIRETGRRIRIEGYADEEDSEFLLRQSTDSEPKAANTWELSSLRSAWAAQYWMRKFNFDPAKMEVVAFGKSKQKRRLEVIIARKGE